MDRKRPVRYRTYTIADLTVLGEKAWKYYSATTRQQRERYESIVQTIIDLRAGTVTRMALPQSW